MCVCLLKCLCNNITTLLSHFFLGIVIACFALLAIILAIIAVVVIVLVVDRKSRYNNV